MGVALRDATRHSCILHVNNCSLFGSLATNGYCSRCFAHRFPDDTRARFVRSKELAVARANGAMLRIKPGHGSTIWIFLEVAHAHRIRNHDILFSQEDVREPNVSNLDFSIWLKSISAYAARFKQKYATDAHT